jgi:uncharacterized protein YkwD
MRLRTRARGLISLVVIMSGLCSGSARACPSDETLDAVAVDVLLGDVEARPSALRQALATRGSSAIEAYVREGTNEHAIARALRSLERRVGMPLRCGRAEAEGRSIVVAAPDVATLRLENGRVRGWLRDGYPNAHLVYRDDEGDVHRVAVDVATLERGVRLPTPFVAHVPELQLVADTGRGPRPLARLPGPLPPSEGGSIASTPVKTIHAVRDAVGAPSLRENALLEREAGEHARMICAARHASHAGMGGDPEARLLARGIAARVIGEAVARASSVAEAMEAILASPSHRAALEDGRFTDVGVGVAARGGTRCVVALLAAFPRAVPPSRPPNDFVEFNRRRSID